MGTSGSAAIGLEQGSGAPPKRPRKSVRVVVFFLYFFGLAVGLPGLVVGLVQAKYGLIDGPPQESGSPWAVSDGRFVHGNHLLATDAMVIDMHRIFPFAEAAALASNPDRTIVLAIRAGSAEAIARAVAAIEQQYRIKLPQGHAETIADRFWHGRVSRDDRHLLMVLAPDAVLAKARFSAMPGLPKAGDPANDTFGETVKTITKYGIFVWMALQFLIFGRVAAWAGGEPAVPGVTPMAAEALMQRLLALNEQDIPFEVTRGTRPNELFVDWRYADAKWADLMRLHSMKEVYRLVLRFDAGRHNVRAQDRYASFRWSAGRGPNLASLAWKSSRGITFYEFRQERVFGLMFHDGKPSFDLSYVYTFNLQELKQPVIEIIRTAGWNYRAVISFFRLIGG